MFPKTIAIKTNAYSILSCILICLVLAVTRLIYTDTGAKFPLKVTTSDALGYYMYLPAKFIYHDEKQLNWFPGIDSTYEVSGGTLYQASKLPNGNFVFKYLGGVSILQLPFFLMAHLYASNSAYPADGFSLPYQVSIAWGCLIYCMLAIFLLRRILRNYFNDITTAITLILLLLASNFIQYVSVDSGQSHGYIFPLYVLVIYFTIQWHKKPKRIWAFLTGLVIGLAIACRPTEAVMIFIPLLWKLEPGVTADNKFQFVKKNYSHLLFVMLGGFLAVLPQILYWKRVTGSWVYDVGSKWDFLNPHFRVLFGPEKGWFIYTPVAILFVAGLFMMKKSSYRNAVITFCLLNIYIIIAWHVWRYGGSYSCRALVQSYPLFAFPLACLTERLMVTRWKLLFLFLMIYLTCVNLFQVGQYNKTIIHYDDMNFKYYRAVYLDPDPTALDMSLLDTPDRLYHETDFTTQLLLHDKRSYPVSDSSVLYESGGEPLENLAEVRWLKFDIDLFIEKDAWQTYFNCHLGGNKNKQFRIRLFNPLYKERKINHYSFYAEVPGDMELSAVRLSVDGNPGFRGELKALEIIGFRNKDSN